MSGFQRAALGTILKKLRFMGELGVNDAGADSV
jgi:hypothetical protein